jgi:hypothetical protein
MIGLATLRGIKRVSPGEELFRIHLITSKLPPHRREYYFSKPRMWRFDFAWPEYMLAVEIEGGSWSNGRHSRGSGFTEDCEKYNRATILGWWLLRFTTEMVKAGVALRDTESAIAACTERLA